MFTERISEVVSAQNEVRSFIRAGKKFSPSEYQPLVDLIKAREIEPFMAVLNELIDKGGFVSKGVKFGSGEVIHWADHVLQILLAHHHMNLWEAVYLKDIICRTGFDRIPSLDIRVTLTAHLASEQKKENVNDHIDIMRLSAGLPAADLLFTDKQRKHELQQTGLDSKYNTQMYSGTSGDITAFYEALVKT